MVFIYKQDFYICISKRLEG